MPTATQAVSVVVIILFVAVAFPTFINSTDSGAIDATVTLDGEGAFQDVDDAFSVAVLNKTTNSAQLELTALRSGASTQVSITETESLTTQLDGANVTVTAVDIRSGINNDVVLDLRYPNNLAWDSGARTLSGNLPIVLAGVALLIPVGMLIWVISG